MAALFSAVILVDPLCYGDESELSKDDLFERLIFASTMSLESGVFEGTFTRLKETDYSNDQLQRDVAAFEDNLRQQIRNGTFPLSESDKRDLMESFGVSDYTKLLGNPTVANQIEKEIKWRVADFRENQAFSQGTMLNAYEAKYYVGTNLRARSERTVLDGTVMGSIYEPLLRQSDVRTVTWGVAKSYQPDIHIGEIHPGSGGEADSPVGSYGETLDRLELATAGSPNVMEWTANDIVSVQRKVVQGTDALEIILDRKTKSGPQLTVVHTVAPGYGYAVLKSEYFDDGKLSVTQEFDKYVKTASGQWYPMKQTLVFLDAELPAELQDALRRGALPYYSEKVRASQKVKARTVRAIELDKVQTNVDFPDELFDLQFPAGTKVLDYTRRDAKGEALRYRVGGFDPKYTAEDALNAVLAGAGGPPDGNQVEKQRQPQVREPPADNSQGKVAAAERAHTDMSMASGTGPAQHDTSETRGGRTKVMVAIIISGAIAACVCLSLFVLRGRHGST